VGCVVGGPVASRLERLRGGDVCVVVVVVVVVVIVLSLRAVSSSRRCHRRRRCNEVNVDAAPG
jgi:hypothetical protein